MHKTLKKYKTNTKRQTHEPIKVIRQSYSIESIPKRFREPCFLVSKKKRESSTLRVEMKERELHSQSREKERELKYLEGWHRGNTLRPGLTKAIFNLDRLHRCTLRTQNLIGCLSYLQCCSGQPTHCSCCRYALGSGAVAGSTLRPVTAEDCGSYFPLD